MLKFLDLIEYGVYDYGELPDPWETDEYIYYLEKVIFWVRWWYDMEAWDKNHIRLERFVLAAKGLINEARSRYPPEYLRLYNIDRGDYEYMVIAKSKKDLDEVESDQCKITFVGCVIK